MWREQKNTSYFLDFFVIGLLDEVVLVIWLGRRSLMSKEIKTWFIPQK